jgi:hypothetical protein
MKSIAGYAALACLSLLLASKSKAFDALTGTGAWPVERVVVFGAETRQTLDGFARRNHLDLGDLKRRHAASGVIHCGNARGAGQLTLADNVVTTAAHVFYDETGALRADAAHCAFTATVEGQEINVPVDTRTIVAGSANPYVTAAAHDWAVARLARAVPSATPYGLGIPSGNLAIRFVARGHSDWGAGRELSLEACRLRDGLSQGDEGTREFAFDCAAGVGASGGALLDAEGEKLLAVFVGFRSVAADQRLAFSPFNYNFAVTVEGAFRRAVIEAAGVRTAEGD